MVCDWSGAVLANEGAKHFASGRCFSLGRAIIYVVRWLNGGVGSSKKAAAQSADVPAAACRAWPAKGQDDEDGTHPAMHV